MVKNRTEFEDRIVDKLDSLVEQLVDKLQKKIHPETLSELEQVINLRQRIKPSMTSRI